MAEMQKIWDNYKVIGEIRKSEGIKFVVAAATREGFRYINIREFYFRKRDGEWKPGRDGITIPIKAPLSKGTKIIEPAKHMLEMLAVAAEAAEKLDLADEAHAVYMEKKVKKA